jgi:hypothetical protein
MVAWRYTRLNRPSSLACRVFSLLGGEEAERLRCIPAEAFSATYEWIAPTIGQIAKY